MRIIDDKHQTSGDITRLDGTPVPEDEELILFRSRDKLLIPLLEHYKQLCINAGSPDDQLAVLQKRIDAIKSWQENNQDKLKVPGVNPQPLQ